MLRPPRTELTAAPEIQAPRLATAWAALVYAVATMLLAYPALSGDFLVWPRSDQYIAGYAFREFAAASLKAGEGFPQWNPYLFGGMPYIAAMHGDIFYPTFLLRMILPTDVAMTWGFIIHLFLSGLFTFGFLRAYGVGFPGALVGGLAYMLSGPIAGYASPGHDGKLFVSTLLPLALWMIVRGMRDNRPWSWGVLALTIGLAVLSPHPQLLQYLLLASGSFALYLALRRQDDGEKLPATVAVTRLSRALGAVVLGFAMGAIQYASVLKYVDWSPRAGGAGWEHAISFSMPPEELINAFVPQFSGLLNDYWGRNNIHLHSEYAGIVVLVLAGAGMFAPAVRRSFRWFWIGTFALSLLWTLGGFTPFYRLIYFIVPGTKFFRAPSTMMYVAMFSLAVFAALGTERIVTAATSISKRFVVAWGAGILALVLLLAAGLGPMVGETFGRADLAQANQTAVMAGTLRSVLFAAAILGVVFAVARGRMRPRVLVWAVPALVALDSWSVARRYWIFSPGAEVIFAADAAIDHMKRDSVPGRVMPLPLVVPPEREGIPTDRAFSGDVMMVHRLRSTFGYHGNELGRYQVFEPQMYEGAMERVLSPAFWRHANVRYWYTTFPDSLMPQLSAQAGWGETPRKVLGPITNRAGSSIFLYRMPGENPAAWVATAMVKAPDEQALATVLDPRFDPARAAIFDTASSVSGANPTTPPPPAGVKANVTRLQPGVIDVQLDQPAPQGAALVVSENFYPGWRATADGRDAQIARANYNLIGVALPAGSREVQLRFADPAYATGKVITLVALLLAVAAIVAGVILQRRHPAIAA